MSASNNAFEPKETDRLFVPIARILASHIGSTNPSTIPQGYPTHPIMSVDLEKDVIIQNAYTRSSYDDEFGAVPNFILDPYPPNVWSTDDVQTFVGDFAMPSGTLAPLRMMAPALGLSPPRTSTATHEFKPADPALDQFRQLLQSMDKSASSPLAHAILAGYSEHLELIFEHTKSTPVSSLPSAEMDVVNEDEIWTIPRRCIPMPPPSSDSLPSRCPAEVLAHLRFILRHAQVHVLPDSAFFNLLSQWFPERSTKSPSWSEELRQEALRYFQVRQLQ